MMNDTDENYEARKVSFNKKPDAETTEDFYKDRRKIVTARFDQKTMGLIKKRIATEEWVIEQLQLLFKDPDFEDFDIDYFLDLDDELERRKVIQDLLNTCPASAESKNEFLNEFLERIKAL